MTHVHTARYQAPACPACGSQPLLGSPSDRHAWFCPSCVTYWTTSLVLVPRSVVADALPNAGATPRRPSKAQDPAHPWPADDNEAAPPPDATGAARPPASAGPAPSRQTGQLGLFQP